MSRAEVTLGYIPLTDAALPIIAYEMGFAAEEGLTLSLVREPSWSNIRDKFAMGVYPAAHMLSPLAIALTAGVGPMTAPVVAPMLLGTNGNTLAARPQLAERLVQNGARFDDAYSTGQALARHAKSEGLRVGVPFPHSMHRELMRLLIERSGGDLEDVSFTTAPPRVLPRVLEAEEIDVFMVGEPWGTVAVDRGAGELILAANRIWSAAPEKVLALNTEWVESNSEDAEALLRALYRASLWIGHPSNISTTAEILALPQYLDTPALLLERALAGKLVRRFGTVAVPQPDILRLSGVSAIYPWQSAAAWIAERAAPLWGISPIKAQAAALETFRPDLLHRALAPLDAALPTALSRVEGRTEAGESVPGTRGPVLVGRSGFFDRSEFSAQI
ncbi:MAG: CmpA/NrtA family ABC transporter substrate-binding protein [Pseudomonadota bacterium]